MPLRPATARWFELLTGREELAAALRCLAATGEVQLQTRSEVTSAHLLPALRAAVDEYKHLAQRYSEYWPAARADGEETGPPEQIASAALERVRAWMTDADQLIVRLQQLAHEGEQLRMIQSLLALSGQDLPDLSLFTHAGPVLASRIYLLKEEAQTLAVPPSVLTQRIGSEAHTFLLATGLADQIAALDDTLSALKAWRIELPPDLPSDHADAATHVSARIESIATQSHTLSDQLTEMHERHRLAAALTDLQFTDWLVQHVPELAATENFAWVTGWTSDLDGSQLETALSRAKLHYLLRFPEAPPDLIRPVVLRNPAWARPFELFARLLGMPGAGEADPSRVVAVIAPLMFGYMFGDVGQGALLIAAGFALRRRYPALAVLIPGGAAAVLFGFLFGSVLTSERIIAPIWLRPIEQPLQLLGASLAFGVVVVLLGLALDAIQQHWSGQGRRWWATRAGLVLCYLGMICAPFDMRALWAVPAGLVWHWSGSALTITAQRAAEFGRAIGESIETVLQLFVNTISFVRVGAFALAHAGLSTVIYDLAQGFAFKPLYWLVLIVGNLLIMTIEGLVVGIQTTRLVLFEFFIRFLRASGRPFLPLSAPTAPSRTPPPSGPSSFRPPSFRKHL